MLGKGALGLKSTKKKLFISAAKLMGLYKGIAWHASSQFEEQEIKTLFPNSKVHVLENLSSNKLVSKPIQDKLKGELKLVFISRISRKKNLQFAIEVVSNLKGNVSIDVFGPVEDQGYWQSCQTTANSLNVKMNYGGLLRPDEVTAKLSNFHAMILPTLHENYGHVVLEAFCAGLPVLISDQTPWRSLKKKEVGSDIPLNNKKNWESELNALVDMSQKDLSITREKVLQYAREKTDQLDLKKAYLGLFSNQVS
jgi:glycosyltransferase involved in cell wall biosynthesis